MIADIFGMDSIIVVIIAVVVLFGSSQLPKLAKNIGSAGREFRRAHQEANGDVDDAAHANSVERIFPKPGETATTAEIPDMLDNPQ